MVYAMKCEAWTWYLPSHIVVAKILCSRCEPCTKKLLHIDDKLFQNRYFAGIININTVNWL